MKLCNSHQTKFFPGNECRLVTIVSRAARKATLRAKANMLVSNILVDRITDRLTVGQWFFLCQLGTNLDPHVFAILLGKLDEMLYSGSMDYRMHDKSKAA